MICLFSDLELLTFTASPPSSSRATDTAIMYLILFAVLCALAALPNIAIAAAIPSQVPSHEATHVTADCSNRSSEGEFLYVVANHEGGAERLSDEDFDITPEGHFVHFNGSQNDTAPMQKHKISPGTPDLPKHVLHAVLDEIAFAVEDDPHVREVIKTSLKSGGIPVQVLPPGQMSNNGNAVLIEVFHLEHEGIEKSGDGQENTKNNAAATDKRLSLTGLLPSENNNESQPSGIPAGSLSRLVHLVGKDVGNVGETVRETRKRRNSADNATVAVQTAKVSSTTPGADSDLSTIIPTTEKNSVGFDKDLQLTTVSPKNHGSSPSHENVPISKNYSSIILIMGSEEETDDDDSDERVKRQGEVNGDTSQEEDLDATSEVTDSDFDQTPLSQEENLDATSEDTDSDFDQTPLSPNREIIHRQRRQAEDGSNISTVNEESLTVTILPSEVDLSTTSVDGISSITESNEESVTITEENISITTESNKESVTSAQGNISSTTESNKESVTSAQGNISSTAESSEELGSSTEENTSSTRVIVSSTVNSILSTEVSITKAEASSVNSIEEETTLSVDEDNIITKTLSAESEVTTTTEANLDTEDPTPSSGEETTTLAVGEDSSEDDDSSESTENTDGKEDDSSEAKAFNNVDIVLDFYDI
ncbi:uncharacterized protein [Macrobrachium rosenbergii]|uniref:uncharacterized protein n=1 Tax=Macrobrachium rosenbergii TaxID=79674 RepID=UPI0034D75547